MALTQSYNKLPLIPIPEPLRAADTGTYSHSSVVVRLPEIGRQMLADNDFSPQTTRALEALIGEIPDGVIRPLNDSYAPDTAEWAAYIAPFEGANWYDIPWFFAETYFYRRVIEASGYFDRDHPYFAFDPFTAQKKEGLKLGHEQIQEMLGGIDDLFVVKRVGPEAALERLLSLALWGNQADLSLWPAGQGTQPQHEDNDRAAAHVLVNQAAEAAAKLMARKDQQIDMVLDNVGMELVSDLCLADFLLFSDTAETVRWHLKIHPTFVSDAVVGDVHETVAWLLKDNLLVVSDLGRRLKTYLKQGRWQLVTHPFWTSPLPMWQMPEALYEQLGRSDFIITKGDANYRRLLGDRHWPYTTPFSQIVSYAPGPLLALRTIKAEVAAGLTGEQIQTLNEKDPEWLINGRWGLIQFQDK